MSREKGRVKKRTYEIIFATKPDDKRAKLFAAVLSAWILLSVMAITIFSSSGKSAIGPPLRIFLIISVAVFSVEFALRLWSVTVDPKYARPIMGRLKYLLHPWPLIDLAAILPFYIILVYGSFAGLNALPIRLLFLFQLILVFKMVGYRHALDGILMAWRNKRTELIIVLTGMWFFMFIAAALLHLVERDVQPEAFGSIGSSMWWAVITLTAVGYGDVVPITTGGKIIAGTVAILGISMFALPTGILVAGFLQVRRDRMEL